MQAKQNSSTGEPQKPTRVLLVTNDDRGGAAVLVSRVARYLDPALFRVYLFVPVRGFIAEMVGDKATIFIEPSFQSTPSRPERGIARLIKTVKTRAQIIGVWAKAARRLSQIIKDEEIQVLSAFGLEPHLFSAIVGGLTNTPVVLNPLQNFDLKINERIDQFAASLPSVKALAAVSETAARPFRFLGSKVHVCFNGIDPEDFSKVGLRLLLRERFSIDKESPVIGFVGRPTHEKGIDIFLRAAALVYQKRPQARFALIGTGVSNTHLKNAEYPFRHELPQMLNELGISAVTTITGAVEDIRPYLADLDIVVIPSRRDAAPLVAFESMALGVAIVGANIHGIPEQIRHEQEGLLAKVGDEHSFAEEIIRLIDDQSLRKKLAEAAHERVMTKFNLRDNVAKMGALYESVIESK
jgi:glycosyltransferase involved in cell wall biosynthesis